MWDQRVRGLGVLYRILITVLLAFRADIRLDVNAMQRQLCRNEFQNLTDKLRCHRDHFCAAVIAILLLFRELDWRLIHNPHTFKHFLPQCARLPLFFFLFSARSRIRLKRKLFFLLLIRFQFDFIKKIQLALRLNHVFFTGMTIQALSHGFNLFLQILFPCLTFSQGFPEIFNGGIEVVNRGAQAFNGIQQFPLKQRIC